MLASHFGIAGGDFGTMQTIQHMRRIVNDATGDPLTRRTAASIGIAHGGKHGYPQARGIRAYLDERCVFLRDPSNRELLHHPAVMLQDILRQGYTAVDCDDVAILGAALGKAIGLRARFVVVGFSSPTAPFRHIWTELSDPHKIRWVECDITRPSQPDFVIGRAKIVNV